MEAVMFGLGVKDEMNRLEARIEELEADRAITLNILTSTQGLLEILLPLVETPKQQTAQELLAALREGLATMHEDSGHSRGADQKN